MVPRGHGKLTLASRDPMVQPRIDLNYCADPEDLRRLMDGVRRAWKLLRSEALANAYQRVAGLTAEAVASDEQLQTYIRANIGTYCHALGTAPIGIDGDPNAVLDQHCQVRGTDNLHVVDASVFPAVPRVVPNLTVMMLAERVASWIAV
jgi:choline dehydrogenase